MKKLIIGLLLAAGVTAANAHVIGTIKDVHLTAFGKTFVGPAND